MVTSGLSHMQLQIFFPLRVAKINFVSTFTAKPSMHFLSPVLMAIRLSSRRAHQVCTSTTPLTTPLPLLNPLLLKTPPPSPRFLVTQPYILRPKLTRTVALAPPTPCSVDLPPHDFANLVRGNLLQNCPVILVDINIADKVFGTDIGSLKEKRCVAPQPLLSPTILLSRLR